MFFADTLMYLAFTRFRSLENRLTPRSSFHWPGSFLTAPTFWNVFRRPTPHTQSLWGRRSRRLSCTRYVNVMFVY